MIQKNDVLTVEITDQDTLGQGIGKASLFPLFVRHAVTGDVVNVVVTKTKKNYGYARILDFVKKSPLRTQPACASYKRCGGCQLQNMTYAAQLEFKQRRVEECVRRIGGFSDIGFEPVLASEDIFEYRNKVQYPVGRDKEGNIVFGFYAERTHEIIPCERCLLSPREFDEIARQVVAWMRKYNISPYDEKSGRGILRHIFIRKGFVTGEIDLCLVINAEKLPHAAELRDALKKFSICSISVSVNKKRNNVILGDKIINLFGKDYIEEKIGDIRFRISPHSFFQINPKQTKRLYDKVLEFAQLTGNETVIDLYCGIGTISLYLAQNARKVYGIEIVPQAIEDAKVNAELNNIKNAEFYAGKAEEVLPRLYRQGLTRADVVVVDPPRKGCDELTLSTIADINPARLIYVSCNPATLARDMKILKGYGFEPEIIQPTDMFPQSIHTESAVLLSKGESHAKVLRTPPEK